MSAFTKLQKLGLVVLIGSLVIGFGGTVWSIYGSFIALATAENAGILGIVGPIIGVLLLIFGNANRFENLFIEINRRLPADR